MKKEVYDVTNVGCKITVTDSTNSTIVTDLEKNEGLVHFNTIINNPQASKLIRNTNGFVLLGDIIYTEQKYLTKPKGKDGVTLDYLDKWKQRIQCGWNLFYRSLESMNMMKINNKNNLKGGNDFNFDLYDNAEILAGNHSFDVDVYSEENFLKSLNAYSKPNNYKSLDKDSYGDFSNKNLVFTYTPRFITITYKDFKIQFLDFNSHLISCMKGDETVYKECNKWNPSVIPFKDALEYTRRFYQAFDKFEDDTPKLKVWRAMRAHHPPLNTEDGDAEFYFSDTHIGDKKIQIRDLMKNKRINIFLGSHIHNAQVIAYPYSRVWVKPAASCTESNTVRWGCFKADNNVFTKNPVYQSQCENNMIYDFPLKDRTDPSETNDMLYVFITGNSGRVFDSLKEGKKSDGILIWSRATQNDSNSFNYGFSYFKFDKYQIEAEFYEVADEGKTLNKAATFVIKEGKLPNADAMENYLNNKCKDTTTSR